VSHSVQARLLRRAHNLRRCWIFYMKLHCCPVATRWARFFDMLWPTLFTSQLTTCWWSFLIAGSAMPFCWHCSPIDPWQCLFGHVSFLLCPPAKLEEDQIILLCNLILINICGHVAVWFVVWASKQVLSNMCSIVHDPRKKFTFFKDFNNIVWNFLACSLKAQLNLGLRFMRWCH
jgi:hypothetical protein